MTEYSQERYEPPYNYEQMIKAGYPKAKADELLKDPVHGWRMRTGIELIHREPSRTELKRTWDNWNLMTPEMKLTSDRKAMELFHCTNLIMFKFLLPQYKTENPVKGVIKYPTDAEIKSMASLLHVNLEDPALHQPSTEAGLLMETETNRNVTAVIRKLIGKNNSIMSNDELAVWIFDTYKRRTENHIFFVQKCAEWLKPFFVSNNMYRGYQKLMDKVQQHDADKFYGTEKVAHYAARCAKYNPEWSKLYDLAPGVQDRFDKEFWPDHYRKNDHHPEHWGEVNYSREGIDADSYTRCTWDDFVKAYPDPIDQAVTISEMVADWSAMAVELGDSANAWDKKTNGERFIWDDEIRDRYLDPLLALEKNDTYRDMIRKMAPHPIETFITPTLKHTDVPDYIKATARKIGEDIVKAMKSYASNEVIITPTHTTVVLSPDKVIDVPRGQMVETSDGQQLYCDPVTGDIKYLNVDASSEALEPSTEAALPVNFKEKRKKIEKYILDSIKLLDRHSDVNTDYWKNQFASMSDTQFDQFMHYLKEHKCNIHIYVPPLKVYLKNAELVDAAHKLGVKLMHRIWMTDEATGMKYLTPEEYMVVQLPVRRQQQFLDEKMSVPDNDKTIDGLTGQVTGDSKACAITNPEIHILQARNLDASLYEFANVRGGNIHNYAEFKRSLEETGSVSLNALDPNNRTRVAVMAGVLLTSMMIDNNLNDM